MQSKLLLVGISLVYMPPQSRNEKLECWEEVTVVKELCEGPWVTCGDFNTVRVMTERRGCNRITNVMKDFAKWIEDMELHDPQLIGGNFTRFRGANHVWGLGQNKSYFKFENSWLKVDGFEGIVHSWWSEFVVEGCPDYKLSMKLKLLKHKLREWSKQVGGDLGTTKNKLLSELTDIDLAQDSRQLTEDKLMASLKASFPDLFSLSLQKVATVKEMRDAQGWNLRESETINHLFLHCKETVKLWQIFINIRGISWSMPGNMKEALACWNRDGNQSGHRERWKTVPAYIWWTIWLERNQRCFESKSCSMEKMKLNCLALFYFGCKHEYPHEDEDIPSILEFLMSS
ncbi:hypothetical protein MTR67_006744 [Solanum verrucosum]|uniref:Uncharacterized protein n=1 Tax=Solanum verrucosum TaxID=315347 RepID=A0AAF0TCG4_SOLVR|nr:hypothetical protein MTR67_006744 [Solanum verrucosum]